MGDPFNAGAIEGDKIFDRFFVLALLIEITHAAQIAYPFFTNGGDKKDGKLWFNAAFHQGARDRDKADQSRNIVADAGSIVTLTLLSHATIGAGGKDGVEMGRE